MSAAVRELLTGLCSTSRRWIEEDAVASRIVLVFVLTQLASIGWDLPCIYGWENDAVAPRDLFGGLAVNLTPGKGHRYPLFHYLVLALVSWPVLLVSVLRAPSLAFDDLMQQVLAVETLTGLALVAKLVSVAMGAVTLLVLGRIVRRAFDATSGRWAIAFAGVNLTVAYYGRVTNLDGPYLMWTALAAHALLDVWERGVRGDYVRLGVFAGASIATKDQAYASYVLTLPIVLVLLPLLRVGPFAGRSDHARHVLFGAGSGALTLAILGGGLFNPTGFVYRLSLLTGTNSEDWRVYPKTLEGLVANVRDLAMQQPEFFWPWPVIALAWFGVLLAIVRTERTGDRGPRMLPALFAISSVLFFTLLVGRCEHRFVLPLGLWLSGYAGVGAAFVLRTLPFRRTATVLCMFVWSLGLHQSVALHLTQWGDARRQVERWLLALPPDSLVEVYGSGIYLPRLALGPGAPYRAQRVAPDDPKRRPPIPGLLEVEDSLEQVHARQPDALVLTDGHIGRFLEELPSSGTMTSVVSQNYQRDEEAKRYFRKAVDDALEGYERSLHARPELPAWAIRLGMRPIAVHGSTGRDVWVSSRRPDAPPSAPERPVATQEAD